MKKLLVVVAGLSAPFTVGMADAADLAQHRPVPQQVWTWTGPYLGAHIGAGWSHANFDSGTLPVIHGNNVLTPSVQGGGQVGYNWQAPGSAWVIGAEAALSALGADGSGTCFATSAFLVSANCRVRQSLMASVTGRVGYAMGHGGRTLVYAKGGGAWLDQTINISSHVDESSARPGRFGWTVGAGIEQAIAPAWSVKLDYDYADFGRTAVALPATETLGMDGYETIPGSTSSARQTMQSVKLGLNLKLGADAGARWDNVPPSPFGFPVKAMAPVPPVGTEIEVGGRVWYSFGRFQEDLGASSIPTQQDPLVSRLTYHSTATSGELFGRIDTASNVVIKGFVGGGQIDSGKMYDEDWKIQGPLPYSSTLSDKMAGSIGYVTADIGYDFIRDRASKVSAFIGYNYLRDDKIAKGCVQLNGYDQGPCDVPFANTVAIISETDDWHALRIGLNGVVSLTEQLKLTADAAYLPYVRYYGVDNHMLRRDVYSQLSPQAGIGQGVQLEAILSYAITPSFSVGAGARYWAMWATGQDAQTNSFSQPGAYNALLARADRYGGFLQASYSFDSAR